MEPLRAATTNPDISDSGLRLWDFFSINLNRLFVFQGESDDSILRLAKNDGVVAK